MALSITLRSDGGLKRSGTKILNSPPPFFHSMYIRQAMGFKYWDKLFLSDVSWETKLAIFIRVALKT